MKSYFATHTPKTLILNQSFMPINVLSWHEVIGPWYTNRAKIIHSYSEEKYRIHSGRDANGYESSIMCPSVAVFYDAPAYTKNLVKTKPLTRKTLFAEYSGICCYCGTKMKFEDYTREHIHPTSRCGLDVWENVAPCCKPCNNRKDNKTLEESGMKLMYKVTTPTFDTVVPKNLASEIGAVIPHETWRQFIYWNRAEVT